MTLINSKSNRFIQDIYLLGSTLALGSKSREICPLCEGGNSREKSLSISLSEDGQLSWNCFRDSCTIKGNSGGSYGVSTEHRPVKKEVIRPKFSGITNSLSEAELSLIGGLWGIADPAYWYYTEEFGGRIAMSIRSPKYRHRGWVLRDISGNARTKALMYTEGSDVITQSWYKSVDRKVRGTILVEDIPSAVRASKYIDSVALLGTGVGIEKAVEIAMYKRAGPVYVALDQDATRQAFKLVDKWAGIWGEVSVLPLEKDIKDMDETSLRMLLGADQ